MPLATCHWYLGFAILVVFVFLFGLVVVVYASCTQFDSFAYNPAVALNVYLRQRGYRAPCHVASCLSTTEGQTSANRKHTHTNVELSRASSNKILLATSSFNNSPLAAVSWLCRWSTHCRIIFLLLNCLLSQQCIRKASAACKHHKLVSEQCGTSRRWQGSIYITGSVYKLKWLNVARWLPAVGSMYQTDVLYVCLCATTRSLSGILIICWTCIIMMVRSGGECLVSSYWCCTLLHTPTKSRSMLTETWFSFLISFTASMSNFFFIFSKQFLIKNSNNNYKRFNWSKPKIDACHL